MQIYPDGEQESVVRNYVCATCWGPLVWHPIQGDREHVEVGCAQGDDCPGNGFVTRRYAEQARIESQHALVEARMNLAGIIPMPSPRSLKELTSLWD